MTGAIDKGKGAAAETCGGDDFAWCNVDMFLRKNEMLIYDFANRILRRHSYDKEDIKMEAAVAYYETLNYINAFKKTKYSTVFTWFYKKRLYARSTLDGADALPASFRDVSDIPHEGLPGEDDPADPLPDAGAQPGGGFNVCLESFIGKVSMKTYRALIILSEASDIKLKRKALCTLFACRTPDDIEQIIKCRIADEIKDAGACLYAVDCLNAAHGRVIVCAVSEHDAERYLKRYGEPAEIRKLW